MVDSKKVHRCYFHGCNASFSRPYKLEYHIKRHNGEVKQFSLTHILFNFYFQRHFSCGVDGCLKSYTTPSHLKRHITKVHEKTDKKLEIRCKTCNLICSNKYSFKKHFNNKHNIRELQFKCTYCSHGFKKKRQLSEHMCIHTGEMPYR